MHSDLSRRSFLRGSAMTTAGATMVNATISPEAAGHGKISVVKAGGIDLLDLLKEGLLAPAKVVNLKEVPGLDAIVEDDDGGLRIGPMVTQASLADHRLLRERYAALDEVLRGSASPQIRNVATLGGNLLQRPRCWYFSLARLSLSTQGRRPLFRNFGREPVSSLRQCALRHRAKSAL